MARISKLHTKEKLTLLEKYLQGYVTATKGAIERYYIDALAGDGQCEIEIPDTSRTQTVNGSPLIAMNIKPEFTKCFFIEIDLEKVEALNKLLGDFPRDRYQVKPGNCNLVITEILAKIPQKAPCFAFLDPEEFEVNWSTIEAIATHKKFPQNKIELLILFPYNMGITRLLPYDRKKFNEETATATLSRILPDNSWVDVYKDRIKGRLKPRDAKKRIMNIYINGLKGLGYKQGFIYSRLIKSTLGRPLYDMIFATDHPLGAKIMKYVFDKDWIGGQTSFLDKLT